MNIPLRFKMVFFPFLFILLGLLLFCSFLNWFLFIKSKTFMEYPTLIYVGIPAILSTLSVVYWLRPRCNRLKFVMNEQPDDYSKLFPIIPIVLLTTVIYFSQVLLEDRLTQVVKLDDIADIYNQKRSKFFSIQDYTVKKELASSYFSFFEHHHKKFFTCRMDSFFVFPVFSKRQESPVVWVGVHFHEKSEERSNREDLEELKDRFIDDSFKKIYEMSVVKFYYLELMTDTFMNDGFKAAVNKSPLKMDKPWLVLLGGYKPLKDKLQEDLASFIVVSILALLIWFCLLALLTEEKECN